MPLCSTCSALTLESLIGTNAQTQKYGYQLADSFNTVRQRAVTCDLCKLVEESFRAVPLPSPSVKKDPAVWASGIPATSPPTTKVLTGVIVACNGRSVTFDLYGNPPLAE
ncbi:hypothetical protein NW756_004645 [Fusarium oxysporum]|nr:hypothetical protein NW763_011185 [Fusarium oxysporum]KAJ4065370.1 hypothetical protein NW753_003804 [Fusarium oxysporum]KAJ4095825.1 hypothetical protein NW756_004645 [Fusarium oxysporum]